MESRSWSLRLALVLAVATAVWVGAVEFANRLVRERSDRPVASARVVGPAGSSAAAR
jgi:hypothetical protein